MLKLQKSQYKKIEKLGEGTYGVVYKANQLSTNSIVALKKIKLDSFEGIPCTAMREIALLQEMNHDNIVKLLDIVDTDSSIYLVFEYLEMDLKKYLDQCTNKIPVKHIMRQILEGIYYCHSHRILHRDLKPQNILIGSGKVIKLADFGLARTYGIPARTFTHEVVTLWYRSPEILLGIANYSTGLDIWSIGCIFAELLTRKVLLPGDSEIGQLFKIFRFAGTPNENIWPGVSKLPAFQPKFPLWPVPDKLNILIKCGPYEQDLLQKMFVLNPDKRISSREALKHPYF